MSLPWKTILSIAITVILALVLFCKSSRRLEQIIDRLEQIEKTLNARTHELHNVIAKAEMTFGGGAVSEFQPAGESPEAEKQS